MRVLGLTPIAATSRSSQEARSARLHQEFARWLKYTGIQATTLILIRKQLPMTKQRWLPTEKAGFPSLRDWRLSEVDRVLAAVQIWKGVESECLQTRLSYVGLQFWITVSRLVLWPQLRAVQQIRAPPDVSGTCGVRTMVRRGSWIIFCRKENNRLLLIVNARRANTRDVSSRRVSSW